jgi:pectate lyase C
MIRTLSTALACLLAAGAYAQTGPTPITGATCVSTGTVTVNTTILVTSGVYDGGCRTFVPGPAMDVNSHSETVAAKSVMFRVENGAKLRNVIISQSQLTYYAAARPINIYAGATLENVNIVKTKDHTAIGIKTAGVVNLSKITAADSVDSLIFGIGINTRVNVSNCVFKNARKVYRQNGGTTYPTHASITFCDISDMTDEVFRTDSQSASATLTNSRLHNVKRICTGYAAGRCIATGNVVY